jgi:hypothetical protein
MNLQKNKASFAVDFFPGMLMLLNIIAGYATEAYIHRITAVLSQHFAQLAIAVLLKVTL